jgi:hypothetical protein
MIGFGIGYFTGRWWLLLVVPPAVFAWLRLSESVLSTDLRTWIALVVSAFSALGVIVGVLIRRFTKPSY